MNLEAKKEESACPPYGKHSADGCSINGTLSPAGGVREGGPSRFPSAITVSALCANLFFFYFIFFLFLTPVNSLLFSFLKNLKRNPGLVPKSCQFSNKITLPSQSSCFFH